MNRQFLTFFFRIFLFLGLLGSFGSALAADEAPDVFVKRVSNETLDAVRSDKSIKGGDINKIMQLVDSKLMQHVNFRRMTALATGPGWRKATPEQQDRLQEEFKLLLIRTYSGALTVKANPFSWTTAWKKHLATGRAGKFLTSMSWAFGL
jgi:phospholipid transport system substrate-binding protein